MAPGAIKHPIQPSNANIHQRFIIGSFLENHNFLKDFVGILKWPNLELVHMRERIIV